MFLTTGIWHIADLKGIDHILFISALCLKYVWSDWRKILILVTAFTIGHSITLALSVFNILNIPTVWTEFLIALTILITALADLRKDNLNEKKYPLIYFFALFFGFIHGMGFSTLLKSMLGHDHQIIKQLFAFNLGLELGQILIVACLLSIFTILAYLGIDRNKSKIFFCGAIAAIALEMCLERLPWKQKEETDEVFLKNKLDKFLSTNNNLNENKTCCLATEDGNRSLRFVLHAYTSTKH